jgi:hypothetical protein
MPMFFLPQQYQERILTLLKKFFKKYLFISIGIFCPSDEPSLLGGESWLLCCEPFAVNYHSCMGHASHLQQPRSVNNPGQYIIIAISLSFTSLLLIFNL